MLPSMHSRWSEDVGQGPAGGSVFAPMQPRFAGNYQYQGPPGIAGGGGPRPVQAPNQGPQLPSAPQRQLNNVQALPMRRMVA